jgi:hypothetical protein
VLALGVAACTAGVKSTTPNPDGGGVDVAPTGGVGGTTPPPATDARPNLPEVAIVEGGTCTPSVTCTPPNGRYCGVIGNGCFGMLDCGTCPADQVLRRKRLRGRAELHGAGLSGRDRYLLRHRGQRLRPGPGLRRLRHQPGLQRRVSVFPAPAACR